jgi:SNF2 family DNA or RNA helicase
VLLPVQIAAACGGASRHLKQYQVAGVNFMLLLARAGVGGSILAGEPEPFAVDTSCRRSPAASIGGAACRLVRQCRLTLPLRLRADEMGLGKTAQLICFLGAFRSLNYFCCM